MPPARFVIRALDFFRHLASAFVISNGIWFSHFSHATHIRDAIGQAGVDEIR